MYKVGAKRWVIAIVAIMNVVELFAPLVFFLNYGFGCGEKWNLLANKKIGN